MKALHHFIVRVPKRFEDTIEVGGQELYLDSKWNEFENRIAYGEIVSVPLRYSGDAKKGDTLIFHHHVTTNSALRISDDLGDDLYMCMYNEEHGQLSQAIAYRSKDTEELHMLADWLFVLPVDQTKEEEKTEAGIIIPDLNPEVRDIAEVYTPHPELEEQNVNPGDIVGFEKSADYKIKLDNDDIVYRMRVQDISYVEVHDD